MPRKPPNLFEDLQNAGGDIGASISELFTKPLVTYPSEVAKRMSNRLTEPKLDRSVPEAQLRGFLGGALEGIGDLISESTSPLEIGLGAIPFPVGKKVFHGSPFKFKEFNPAHADRLDTLGNAIHFAENPRYAERYARGYEKTHRDLPFNREPNIRVSELDIENGLDLIDAFSSADMKRLLDAGFPTSIMKRVIDAGPRERVALLHKVLEDDPGILKSAGYDAVRYQDIDEPAWAVFDPTREKLETVIDPGDIGKYIQFESRITPEDIISSSKDPIDIVPNELGFNPANEPLPGVGKTHSPMDDLEKAIAVLDEYKIKPNQIQIFEGNPELTIKNLSGNSYTEKLQKLHDLHNSNYISSKEFDELWITLDDLYKTPEDWAKVGYDKLQKDLDLTNKALGIPSNWKKVE